MHNLYLKYNLEHDISVYKYHRTTKKEDNDIMKNMSMYVKLPQVMISSKMKPLRTFGYSSGEE